MRELGDDYKLSFRSTSEVYEAFGTIVARMGADRSIRFVGKNANRAAVLNALVLWLDSQDVPTQKRVVAEGMARLNSILRPVGVDEAPADGVAMPDVFIAQEPPKRHAKRGA